MTTGSKIDAHFSAGVSAAKAALDSSNEAIMCVDQAGSNECANYRAMGWNSVCGGDENKARLRTTKN